MLAAILPQAFFILSNTFNQEIYQHERTERYTVDTEGAEGMLFHEIDKEADSGERYREGNRYSHE